MPRARVLHLSTVHPRRDVRILYREARSLAAAGDFEVTLGVADGLGDETIDAVRIIDLGALPTARLARAASGLARSLALLRRLRPDLLHVHDPELIPLARAARMMGIVAVFDMHENVPLQIAGKPWIPAAIRGPASRVYRLLERPLLAGVGVVFAEQSYTRHYRWVSRSVQALNFPDLDLLPVPRRDEPTTNEVVYLGGITLDRGIGTTAAALASLRARGHDLRLLCVGPIHDERVRELPAVAAGLTEGWITFTGALHPQRAWERIAHCLCGVALLEATGNYRDSYPTKIFEYMALGIPVIASDFPLYREVIVPAGAGLVCEPGDIDAIAAGIEGFARDPDALRALGRNARAAVEARYDWAGQARQLADFYRELLGRR